MIVLVQSCLSMCVVVLLNKLYHHNTKGYLPAQSPPPPIPTLLIISFQLVWTRFIIFHVHPQIIYCNYVKFHQYQSNC